MAYTRQVVTVKKRRRYDAEAEAERKRDYRARIGARTIEIPAETASALSYIRERDGDASDAATVRRLIERAYKNNG
jgi:hypothetical protein